MLRILPCVLLTLLACFPLAGCDSASGLSEAVSIETAQGRTMGTTYMVKLANPPASLPANWRLSIDAELRQVNDQMSTYLKSSELSRFNQSQTTDWFPVSPETAEVVQYALEVSQKTDGAFDVTVAPLVNAWSFGTEPRTRKVPPDEQIAELKEQIGYQHLSVQMEPPSLKKDIAGLTVDLSAIAKGHGVDRLVDTLAEWGVNNAFVEIGGEVRVIGKHGDRKWGVGIQQPDTTPNAVLTAVPVSDVAIATSGDYRNFFETEGQRFSHTIDPRTGRPIQHKLASVSVAAKNCMMADAWATAINVLGDQEGAALAKAERLDVMMVVRKDDGYDTVRTGIFDKANQPASETQR